MLTFKSLLFTILVPGTVAGLIPYLIVSRSDLSLPLNTGLQVLGVMILAAGAAILGCCVRDFAAKGRGTLAPIDPPKQLVVQGLYRYVRNPMYLGVLLLLLGETTLFQSHVLLQYTIAWFAIVNLVVMLYEEPSLRRRFGESYERYYHSVNRWLPSRPTGVG